MATLGIDAHKRTHTVVAVEEAGRELGSRTTMATTSEAHLELVRWAERFGGERCWAVEDCRHLSRPLEADLLAAGERIVRVPPKLMAQARDAARTYGKSGPIDAAVHRMAITRRRCHPDAAAYLQRRTARGDTPTEALRALKRRLSDIVYRAPLADATPIPGCLAEAA
jgi:transposase